LIDENSLWIFIYENGEARYTDLIRAFVDTGKRSKATLLNYKTQLEAAGKIAKKISDATKRPVYYVPKRLRREVQKLKNERQLVSLISSIDARWLDPLRNLLIKVKHEHTYLEGFLNTNCITFIGDIPCTFHKSIEGIQSHIAFVKGLHERHQRDLDTFREEYMNTYVKGDAVSHARVNARIREEVGWSVGEYLRKLLKKAEREEGVRKIMTVLGITEEMLDEMYKEKD
jgi:hypothetical protein